MFCPHCGNENPDTAKHCGHCGKQLALAAPDPSPAAKPPAAGVDWDTIFKWIGIGFVALIVLGMCSNM